MRLHYPWNAGPPLYQPSYLIFLTRIEDKEHLCSISRAEQKNVSKVVEKSKCCTGKICWETLNSYSQTASLNLQTHPRLLRIHSPVRVLLQHLVDADSEGFVIVAFVDEIFVYPKLGSSHCFALRDTWQVKTKFSVMPSHWQELFIVLHWNKKEERKKTLGVK